MRPNCYNRPPFAEGRWHGTGNLRVRPCDKNQRGWRLKPVIRWHWRWFEDRCVIHDGRGIGQNGENYPDAHGWDCSGCRWEPRKSIIGEIPVVFDVSIRPGMILAQNSRGQIEFIDSFEPVNRSIIK